MSRGKRLVIVSNRLPLTVERYDGEIRVQPSCGGLVTALRPLLKDPSAAWIGWSGSDDEPGFDERIRSAAEAACELAPVYLTAEEKAQFYDGCCNQILWPLFHDLLPLCSFQPAHWDAYLHVTEKYADAVERTARPGDIVWAHDYHLLLLAEALSARSFPLRLSYFHHVPFPPPDVFLKLPWRKEVLRGLLHFASIGFQTARDRLNFVACVRACLRDVRVKRAGRQLLVAAENRSTLAGAFPISIDFREFEDLALSSEVTANAAEIQRSMPGGQIVLGIDRLDYTKGVPERLHGFRELLETHPELRGKVTLLQVVVPSRESVPAYRSLKHAIEETINAINQQFALPGWEPIVYLHRCLSRSELVALYRAADVALITPLKDGMNLVAKEFCASRVDEDGVLVLSEFAGAARELKCGALLVNPCDFDGVAWALYRALRMSAGERCRRMQKMREWVRAHDVFRWCESICGKARHLPTSGKSLAQLSNFPAQSRLAAAGD